MPDIEYWWLKSWLPLDGGRLNPTGLVGKSFLPKLILGGEGRKCCVKHKDAAA